MASHPVRKCDVVRRKWMVPGSCQRRDDYYHEPRYAQPRLLATSGARLGRATATRRRGAHPGLDDVDGTSARNADVLRHRHGGWAVPAQPLCVSRLSTVDASYRPFRGTHCHAAMSAIHVVDERIQGPARYGAALLVDGV